MATTSYTPEPLPLTSPVVPVAVYRWDSSGRMMGMPNIRFLGCRFEEGSTVPQATFRYVFDRGGAVDTRRRWPASPEEVIGADADGPYVVKPDDRLTVYATTQAGDRRCIWDGFAMIPAATITGAEGGRAGVSFLGLSTPIRCYDRPLARRVQRDGDDPEDPKGDTEVDLPAQFNPKGKGNCTPEGKDARTGDFEHPTFIDHLLVAADPDAGRLWDVAGAARYVLARGNSAEEYVRNPNFAALAAILDARDPGGDQDAGGYSGPGGTGEGGDYTDGGSGDFDNADPATFTSRPLRMKELDVKGLAWPDALDRILRPHGFLFRFELSQDDDDKPTWRVRVYREADDDSLLYKQVYLQAGPGALDPGRTNVHEIHLARDPVDTANEYAVETALVAYEVAAVLAPGYEPHAGDEATLKKFDLDGPDFKGNEDKYRLYVFDECGEGHWDFKTSAWVEEKPPSFKDIMGGPDADETLYVRRRRPGRNTLFSKANGSRRNAVLLLSWDYEGPQPGLWDGTGTWHAVSKTWKLLADRLGIRLTAKNPEAWHADNAKIDFGVNVRSAGGKVNGVTAQAATGETRFALMLATVVDGDRVFRAEAPKRDASPSRFAISRVIEARDRYRYDVVTRNSWYNQTDDPVIDRDDGQAATDDALSRRAANEMPRLAGPVVIRRLVNAYEVGDRITGMEGRKINFQTNVGDAGGEGASYPRIVAIEITCDPEQTTTLHLEDDRGGRRARRESWRQG